MLECWPALEKLPNPSNDPCPMPKPRKSQKLLARRHQLLEMFTAEKNRLATAVQQVRPQLQEHIEGLQRQLERLNQDLGTLIRSSLVWRAKEQLLRSVPGVGPVLCSTLLGHQLPELGSFGPLTDCGPGGVAPSTETAALRGAGALCGEDAVRCGPPSTWGHW